MENNTTNRLSMIDNKILIKDNFAIIITTSFVLSIIYLYLFKINNIDKNTIMSFEQSIFVIISAIILVFNESLISYSSISKITNLLNNLKKNENKDLIFSKIGKTNEEVAPNYDEYLNVLDKRLKEFKNQIDLFRKNSYILYSLFTISGFVAILISLTSINFSIDKNIHSSLHIYKPFIVEFFIMIQIFLIPSWIISAYQAEIQKSEILSFFRKTSAIVADFKLYLEEIENKNIDAIIKSDIS